MIWTSLDAGKTSKPKCNKILWIKTGMKRPCDLEPLLWTSTKDRMKRVGKLIGASIIRAYKNAHLSIGMVYKWEIGQIEWQEIRKNKQLSSVSSWEVTRGLVPYWMEVPVGYWWYEQVQLGIEVRVQLYVGKVLGIPLLVTTCCDNSRVSRVVTWKSPGGIFAVRFSPFVNKSPCHFFSAAYLVYWWFFCATAA